MSPGPWQPAPGRPLIIGHRGASAQVTENTLESFEAARNAGADGIELDVRACADSQLVVFHDENLIRLASRGELIERLSLDAVRRVRLPGGRHIPTLDEVFAAFAGTDFVINVELKTGGFRGCVPLVEAVLACIERHQMTEHVLLSSFDPIAIARVRTRNRHIRTGFIFHGGQVVPFRRAWFATTLRPFALHPERKLVTRANIAQWRQRGYAVNTWTIDNPDLQRHVAVLGVDAIMTNDPATCLAQFTGAMPE